MISFDSLVAYILAPLGVAGLGWTGKKTIAVVKQVENNTTRINGLEEDVKYTRDRVDAIYDHLITGRPKDR